MLGKRNGQRILLPFVRYIPAELPQILKEVFRSALIEAGKDTRQVFIAEMICHGFTQHLPEIRSDGQVASFVKLFWLKTRPASVHSAAFYRPAQNKHHVGMAVVCAAISIFPCCTAKL